MEIYPSPSVLDVAPLLEVERSNLVWDISWFKSNLGLYYIVVRKIYGNNISIKCKGYNFKIDQNEKGLFIRIQIGWQSCPDWIDESES